MESFDEFAYGTIHNGSRCHENFGNIKISVLFAVSFFSVLFLSILYESTGGFDLKLNDKEVQFEGIR